MAPASVEYSIVKAFPLMYANLFALCSLDKAEPIGVKLPDTLLPPQSKYDSLNPAAFIASLVNVTYAFSLLKFTGKFAPFAL